MIILAFLLSTVTATILIAGIYSAVYWFLYPDKPQPITRKKFYIIIGIAIWITITLLAIGNS